MPDYGRLCIYMYELVVLELNWLTAFYGRDRIQLLPSCARPCATALRCRPSRQRVSTSTIPVSAYPRMPENVDSAASVAALVPGASGQTTGTSLVPTVVEGQHAVKVQDSKAFPTWDDHGEGARGVSLGDIVVRVITTVTVSSELIVFVGTWSWVVGGRSPCQRFREITACNRGMCDSAWDHLRLPYSQGLGTDVNQRDPKVSQHCTGYGSVPELFTVCISLRSMSCPSSSFADYVRQTVSRISCVLYMLPKYHISHLSFKLYRTYRVYRTCLHFTCRTFHVTFFALSHPPYAYTRLHDSLSPFALHDSLGH